MRRDVVCLWLALAVAWLATAGVRPLLEPDEARYAEIPREMYASGDWITPRLNGVAYFEKPPLQYWGTALAYTLFGVREWSARLFGVGVSFLALPLCAWLARRLGGSDEAALAAVSALAASPRFTGVAQINLLDGAFTTLLCASVFSFVAAQTAPDARGSRRDMLLAWGALGLAVLAKGIVALVLTGATLVAYTLLARDLSPWRRLHLLPGLALFALVTAPWFVAISLRNADFLWFFFVHEHFERFLTTVHRRSRPIWYFVPVLAGGLLPFLGLLPAALRAAFAAPHAPGAFRGKLFLALFATVVFAFFSASGSKLAPYVLPCLPPLAVLLAPALAARPRAPALALAVTSAGVALAGLALLVLGARAAGLAGLRPGLAFWALAALGIAFGAALAGWRLRANGSPAARWAPLALGAVLGWQAVLAGFAELPPTRTVAPLAAEVAPQLGAETRVYSVGQYRQGVPFYLQRTVRLARFRGELAFGLAREPGLSLPTFRDFVEEWNGQSDAVAFLDPRVHEKLVASGLPGRILAADEHSVVVARR